MRYTVKQLIDDLLETSKGNLEREVLIVDVDEEYEDTWWPRRVKGVYSDNPKFVHIDV